MTAQEAMATAVDHHQAGRVAEAVAAYERALEIQPDYFEAWVNLGGVLRGSGQVERAIEACRAGLRHHPNRPELHFNLGNAFRDVGKGAEAIASYGRAIELRPAYAEAHHNLAVALRTSGELEAAMRAERVAIGVRPEYAEAHNNLGVMLTEAGRIDEAIGEHLRAIQLNSRNHSAYSNLGNALREKRDAAGAIAAYRKAIALRPDSAEAHVNLATALMDAGQLDDAMLACHRAIELNPRSAQAYNNLGNGLSSLGRTDEAIAAFYRAIELGTSPGRELSNLSAALGKAGRVDEAIVAARRAVELDPQSAGALNNLGIALAKDRDYEGAADAYEKAIQLSPDYAEAHNNLAIVLKEQGKLDAAVMGFGKALELKGDYAEAHGNLLLTLHYQPDQDRAAVFAQHRRWGERHAPGGVPPHPNDPSPDRPLRIGFVSPDFRYHSVAFFLLPLLESLDRQKFHVTLYSTWPQRDDVTDRLKSLADVWEPIHHLNDQAADQRIRTGQIDVLVDLAGHTAHNRLVLFGRKPAPVQATWLGYPDTTGVAAIDWRITDWTSDPAGSDAFYVERLLRLPRPAWCYSPLSGSPEIELPARTEVVFGCFNDAAKINDPLLRMWARILQQVPHSKLLLKNRATETPSVQKWLQREFEAAGIAWNRIELMRRQTAVEDHLRSYNRIDVAFDTYPYHGTTTTCEALWMGVPVVSRVGQSHVSRVGASLLTSVGLPNLLATNDEEYITLGTDLAADIGRRRNLRTTLRDSMRHSLLMDSTSFAREMEAAFRSMWGHWCDNRA